MPRRKEDPPWWTNFALEYLNNGNNGVQAYLAVRPKSTPGSASVFACRLLANVNFRAFFKKMQDKLAAELHYSKLEWLSKLVNVAKFDPSMLFEPDAEGNPVLKSDWQKICNRHHALRSIKAKKTVWTKNYKNGDQEESVTTALAFDAHSSMEANEKLGRVFGYDKTEVAPKMKIEDMNLFILQLIDGFNKLPEKSVKQIETSDDVESLLRAKVVNS